MSTILRTFTALFFALGSSAFAQVCSVTISPPADVSATVAAATPGSVVCLTAGTYSPPSPGFPNNGAFAIGNSVIVRGLGPTPASVVLQGSPTVDHAVYFTNYLTTKSASGSQLINLTIQGSQGGIQIQNFTLAPSGRLTDIKLKDIIINSTVPSSGGFGIKIQSSDRIVVDNVSIASHQAALNLINVTDSVVMNSTITNTIAVNAPGLSVLGGSNNRFVNNVIGSPKTGSSFSFNGGGIVFYNTSENRFEGNTVQGMRDDALDFTIADLSVNGIPLQQSLNNYVGKNIINHTAFAQDGLVLGSAGIWSNCGSNGTWIFGNDSSGNAECGACIWGSRSNMVLGNKFHNNGIVGTFVSGAQEALDNCAPAGSTAFRQKPLSNFLLSNSNFFNKNDQIVVRDADVTEISRNFTSPNNGFGGVAQSCTNPACQAAYSIESDNTVGFDSTTDVRILANTSINNIRGIWSDSVKTTGIEFFLNRTLNSTNSRIVTNSTISIDRDQLLGGNMWTQFVPTGNPSNSPFVGVFDSQTNTTGKVVDRFPYQSENLGRGYNIDIVEPIAGSTFAQGTRRTVRWDSIGCVWVDLELAGVSLLQNSPNTGYAIVDIPLSSPIGSSNITAKCKDSAGTVQSQASSPSFFVSSSSLVLTSPGRDDLFNTGQFIWVTWKHSPDITSLVIEYSSNGGITWPTTLATVDDLTTNSVTSTRVKLPPAGSAYSMIRIRSGTTMDQTDGVFSVRGASGFGFANTSPSRIFKLGQMERLEWSSPQNSRLVTLDATVGAKTINIAKDLPDRGYFDWIVPDLGAGALTLNISYKPITATSIIASVANSSAGITQYPTTITFGSPPTITPPGTGVINVNTNSGAAPTVTSDTPGTCSVNGFVISGVSNGLCTVTANAAALGNFAVALPSKLSFSVGQAQTISFNSPGAFLAVSSSLNLSASSSSGLPIEFSSLTPSVCSTSGSILTGNAVGTCTVVASQPGSSSFAAATPVQHSLQSVAASAIPRLVNISTRMQVLTGGDVMIGGFIIGGTVPKTVVVRARGPSLLSNGIANFLANPMLQLFSGSTQIANNDDWKSAGNQSTLFASGFAPDSDSEAAIYTTLAPGAYTAIVTGVGGTTGVGIVEVFEVDKPEVPLINIATRGQVLTGNDVMIGGFIIQGSSPQTVVVRARGPSMIANGITNALANPKLQLYSGATEIASNDDWQSAANQSELAASGFAPSELLESSILTTLNPGAYTVIVTGVGGTTGVAIVEVFAK
jgi:hypothetical protein